MRAYTFTDQALAKHAGRFVWLATDVEDGKNAAFLEKFPWEAVPTFLVIDPATEKVVYKWLGAVNTAQLIEHFDKAEQAWKGAAPAAGADVLLKAEQAYQKGAYKDAAAGFEQALAAKAVPEAQRPHVIEAWVNSLSMTNAPERCVRVAQNEAPRLPKGTSYASVVLNGLACALGLPKEAPARAEAIKSLEPLVRESLAIDGVLADDRSAAYDSLVSAREELGDKDGAKAVAQSWLTFLDTEGTRAPSPDGRSALDGFRVSAAIRAGTPERALPALEASERDLPSDYNPPARMARVLLEMGRYDDAVKATDRALAKAYGPRKVGIYELRATILEKQGDKAGAKKTLEDAVAFAGQLPAAQRRESTLKRLNARIAKLG